jgi:large subunit ribosomal protein L10
MTEDKKSKQGRQSVNPEKEQVVNSLIEKMNKYQIVGIVNMENLPARQLNNMRTQLRDKVEIIMTKAKLISLALKKSNKKGVADLEKYLRGMPAVLLSNDNPFSLFKTLKKNRSNAPIKGGQIAPNDIVVPAGKTPFAPGPIIGELGAFRIKTGVEEGKVAIKEDAVVAKEGEEVNQKLAGLLTRLAIEPMEIGLNLAAVYEKGEILTKDVLDIDEEAYINDIKSAASMAFNLAFNAAVINDSTLQLLLSKASSDALALARQQAILTSETVKETIAKAEGQMQGLKTKLNIPDAPSSEKSEESEDNKEE